MGKPEAFVPPLSSALKNLSFSFKKKRVGVTIFSLKFIGSFKNDSKISFSDHLGGGQPDSGAGWSCDVVSRIKLSMLRKASCLEMRRACHVVR